MQIECCPDTGQTSDAGETCEPSPPHPPTMMASGVSISLRAASLVRTSALPAGARDLAESDPVYGSSFTGSFAYFDRDSCSLKTCQQSFLGDSELSSPDLPVSGFMLNGLCFPRAPWVHHIHAKGCSLLPTVTKSDGGVLDSAINDRMEFRPDIRHGKPRRLTKDGRTWSAGLSRLFQLVTGQKMPAEVAERLMGFPVGWTKLEP